MNIDYTILSIFRSATAAVIGLTVHEFAHAFAAYQLGDTTARDQGRLTLNPLKHLDWVGFFLIVIAGFGWAKPVSFQSENLKRKHRDEILIALAGPFSNLVIGILFLVVARCLYFSAYFNTSFWGLIVVDTFLIWGVINFGLFVFNLIPIPPLDGSHIYTPILKEVNPGLLAVRTRVNFSQDSCKLIFCARANSPENFLSARANSISNRANLSVVCTMG